jgi:hypothetical protein
MHPWMLPQGVYVSPLFRGPEVPASSEMAGLSTSRAVPRVCQGQMKHPIQPGDGCRSRLYHWSPVAICRQLDEVSSCDFTSVHTHRFERGLLKRRQWILHFGAACLDLWLSDHYLAPHTPGTGNSSGKC